MGKPTVKKYVRAIYGLCGPDQIIRFIGLATYAPERLANHKHRSKDPLNNHTPLYVWIQAVGTSNVKAVLLETFADDDKDAAYLREAELIKEYRAANPVHAPLLNTHDGGNPDSRVRRGKDHPRYGHKNSPEQLAAMVKGRKEYLAALSEIEKLTKNEAMAIRVKESFAEMSHGDRTKMLHKQDVGREKWLTETDPEQIAYTQSRGPHVYWHINRAKPNPDCIHCQEAEAA